MKVWVTGPHQYIVYKILGMVYLHRPDNICNKSEITMQSVGLTKKETILYKHTVINRNKTDTTLYDYSLTKADCYWLSKSATNTYMSLL